MTEIEREKRSNSANGPVEKHSRTLFSESLDMNFKGSVYHPRFMDFDLLLGVNPRQLKENNGAGSGGQKFRNEFLSKYAFNALVLKDKPLSGSFSFDRMREVSNSDFFERQTSDITRDGQKLAYRQPAFPVNASHLHSINSIRRSFRPELLTEEDLLNVNLTPRIPVVEDVQIDLSRQDFMRQEEAGVKQSGRLDTLSIMNNRSFGDDREHDIFSSLHYDRLTGVADNSNLSVNENLTLKLNESLKSVSQANHYDRTSVNGFTHQNSARTGLRHQLFESLTSSADIKGALYNTSSYDETRAGFEVSEDYQKNIGSALFHLGFDYDLENQKHDSLSPVLNIDNEKHRFDGFTPVYLDNPGADIVTVRVSNEINGIVYDQDQDYTLIQDPGGKVEIRRLSTGDIKDGDTVAVSYRVNLNPSYQLDQVQRGYRTGLDFFDKRWTLYHHFSQRQYDKMKGAEELNIDPYNDYVYGSQVDAGWIRASIEYEEYMADRSPYNALRLTQAVPLNVMPRTDLLVSVREDFVQLPQDSHNDYDVRAVLIRHFSGMADYRMEAGRMVQKGSSWDLDRYVFRNSFRKQMNLSFFECGYDYEQEIWLGQERWNHYVYMNFKRMF